MNDEVWHSLVEGALDDLFEAFDWEDIETGLLSNEEELGTPLAVQMIDEYIAAGEDVATWQAIRAIVTAFQASDTDTVMERGLNGDLPMPVRLLITELLNLPLDEQEAFVAAHPDLMTEEAWTMLLILAQNQLENGDPMTAHVMSAYAELLQAAATEGLATAFTAERARQATASTLADVVNTLLAAKATEEKKALIQARPELRQPEALDYLNLLIDQQEVLGDTRMENILQMHQDLLALVGEMGMDAAFAAALPDTPVNGVDAPWVKDLADFARLPDNRRAAWLHQHSEMITRLMDLRITTVIENLRAAGDLAGVIRISAARDQLRAARQLGIDAAYDEVSWMDLPDMARLEAGVRAFVNAEDDDDLRVAVEEYPELLTAGALEMLTGIIMAFAQRGDEQSAGEVGELRLLLVDCRRMGVDAVLGEL